MSVLTWLLRGILFVILLGLAIKNSSDVELRFFFDARWEAPLAVVILAATAFGVVLGLLALVPQVIRQRRNISRLTRQIDKAAAGQASVEDPPRHAAG